METKQDRVVRIACKCPCCKHKWIESATLKWSPTFGWNHEAGGTHRCDGIRSKLWQLVAEITKGGTKGFGCFNERQQNYDVSRWIRHDIVKGYVNSNIKCDARCINATGHNCECACGGKNHGQSSSAN